MQWGICGAADMGMHGGGGIRDMGSRRGMSGRQGGMGRGGLADMGRQWGGGIWNMECRHGERGGQRGMGGRTGMGMQHERVGDWAKGWVTCVWGTREPEKAPAGVRTSVAELFYLRHMRSGAASAVGAQRGGGKGPGVIKGVQVAWPGDGEVGVT